MFSVKLPTLAMPLKVRPFVEFVPRDRDAPMLEFRGEIDGAVFVVSVLGQRVALDTAEVGADQHGNYALIREGVHELRDGFKLEIELDPDEDGYHGTFLHLFAESAESRIAAEVRLRERGMEPDAAKLLGVVDRSFGVSLDHWGKVNGRSWVSKAVITPDAAEDKPN